MKFSLPFEVCKLHTLTQTVPHHVTRLKVQLALHPEQSTVIGVLLDSTGATIAVEGDISTTPEGLHYATFDMTADPLKQSQRLGVNMYDMWVAKDRWRTGKQALQLRVEGQTKEIRGVRFLVKSSYPIPAEQPEPFELY